MKQTEIGLIPDDWEVKRLGDSVDILRGGSPRPIENYLTTNADGINWIKIGDVKPNDKYIRKTEEKIIPEGKSRSREVKKGDFILSNSMSFGRPYILAIDGCIHDGWLTIQKYAETFDKEFLYYLLGSDEVFNQYVQMAAGSSVQNLNKDKVADLQLKIPPLPEQQRIAKALSDVDALISTTEKLIQKKKNIKQGAMQNLLTGKKRLPGFGDKQTDLFVPNGTHTKEVKDVSPEQIRLSAKMKQTELGEIPEDWEVKSLGEIFEFRPNNTFTRDCLNDSKGKYQNVHYGDVLIKYPSILDCSKETIPFINEGINVKFSKYGIVEGDIIIADTAEDETVGKVVEVFNLGEKKIVSGLHTFLCRKITDDFAPKWLGYFMNQAIFHNQLLPFITGTKVSAISRTAIQNVKVLIPSKEEQTAITNVLSSMDKEIETLNTKLEKYINLKTAMMQQLLTGKVRFVK